MTATSPDPALVRAAVEFIDVFLAPDHPGTDRRLGDLAQQMRDHGPASGEMALTSLLMLAVSLLAIPNLRTVREEWALLRDDLASIPHLSGEPESNVIPFRQWDPWVDAPNGA